MAFGLAVPHEFVMGFQVMISMLFRAGVFVGAKIDNKTDRETDRFICRYIDVKDT